MKNTFPLLITLISLFYINTASAQLFTKVTDSPVVRDSCNSYYASWGDFDSDGDLDLYLPMWFGSPVNPFAKNYLYQNNCNENFTKVQAISGGLVTESFAGSGAYWIDYNNDNLLDLYVFASRESNVNNSLYENQKEGGFVSIDNAITQFNGANAAFADFNNDGILDLYAGDTLLFIGNSSGGYTPVVPSPIYKDPVYWSRNAIGTWADYDNDGDIDLLVITAINDGTMKNYLFMYNNNGAGSFQIDTLMLPYTDWSPAYGCAWGDYDNDLDLDLWINRNGGYDILLNNDGHGNFTQITTGPVVNTAGVCQAGAAWADYDNDGDLDLFVPTFYENFLFDNNGDGTFVKNTTEQFHNDAGFESYGACWADYNNDGDLDLFVNTGWANANDFLYKNNLYENNGTGFHYLKFECHGITGNADAIGTRIYAKANINGQDVWQMREINANTTRGGESGGASGHVVHMGFGNATVIDTLKIYWPASNTTQIFTQVTTNQFISIYENSNSLNVVPSCIADLPVENPAIVTGKLYNDENNNCIFDAGDSPIANHFIQATPGPYFAITDNDGNYSLEMPEGDYNVTFEPSRDEPWVFRKCNADSIVHLSLNSSSITTDIDFPLYPVQKEPCPCVTVNISSIGYEQDNCPPGQVLSTPCPQYHHIYCFEITNCGTTPILSTNNPEFNIWLDDYISISNILGNTCGSVTLNEGIPTIFSGASVYMGTLLPGQSCQICFEVYVLPGATPIYPVTVLFSANGSPVNTNLIVNGDFESGYVGFTSDYGISGPATPGFYSVSPNPQLLNPNHIQTDHTTGSGNLLSADCSINPNEYVWISPVYPVINNTNYVFSGFFNNIVRPDYNLRDPRYVVDLNGLPIVGPRFIDEIPDVWVNENNIWCSNSSSAQLKIRSLRLNMNGNDLGIDDLQLIRADGYAYHEDTESCACDPNDKNVYPEGCGEEGNIPYGTELEYLVRFENIGTGAAHNIIVRDMLDADLDITSLQILASSHHITSIQIIPNNTLIINFDDIELPGVQYEPANKGFIKFKIKPKDALHEGTQIENRADIYFNQNEVVLTNTTLNTIRSFPYPDVNFSAVKECTDSKTIDFEYTGLTSDGASYYWEFGPDATPSVSTDMKPQNIVFSDYGFKNVTLTVYRYGCMNSVSDSLLLESPECGNGKVLVCHNGHTICISENALPAHLAHGDCIGQCGMNLRNSITDNIEADETLIMNISPNPVITSTTISVFSPVDKEVRIQILNSMGVLIETIYSGILESNSTKEIVYSTEQLSGGIYFIYLEGKNIRKVQKMTIIK